MQTWIYSFGTTGSTFIFVNKDFDNAKDKVLMGSERKSMAMDEQEKHEI